jgi:hypothetical protein
VTIPIVMSQRTRMHPAMIAIGVVVVGQLFGFVGLFVAVPILSLIVIATEEFWVKEIEAIDRERRRPAIELPGSGELDDRDHHPDQDEDQGEDLDDDPEAGRLHRGAPTR